MVLCNFNMVHLICKAYFKENKKKKKRKNHVKKCLVHAIMLTVLRYI